MDVGNTGADTPLKGVPEEGRGGQPAMPLDPPGPDRKAADLRNDAAEEERRQKLRQVHILATHNTIQSSQIFCRAMGYVMTVTSPLCSVSSMGSIIIQPLNHYSAHDEPGMCGASLAPPKDML